MDFITCEPNLNSQPNYLDESDRFFENPNHWYLNNKKKIETVTHVVLFRNIYRKILDEGNNHTDLDCFRNYMKKFEIEREFFTH